MTANDTRAAELSSALKDLHRALIRAEAGEDPAFENPYTLLFTMIGGDPRFQWMEDLSGLIVRLDEARDGDEPIDAALPGFAHEAAVLLGTKEGAKPQFRLKFLMAVQNEPQVGLATGGLRRVLAEFPDLMRASR